MWKPRIRNRNPVRGGELVGMANVFLVLKVLVLNSSNAAPKFGVNKSSFGLLVCLPLLEYWLAKPKDKDGGKIPWREGFLATKPPYY